MRFGGIRKLVLFLAMALPFGSAMAVDKNAMRDCRKEIERLALAGPGASWLLKSEVRRVFKDHGINTFIHARAHKCPFCETYFPHMGNKAEVCKCPSCSKSFSMKEGGVHKVFDASGKELVHIGGIDYGIDLDRGAETYKPLWICAFCRTNNNGDAEECSECGKSIGDSTRQIVEVGPNREVTAAPNTLGGYKIEDPDVIAADRAADRRREDAQAAKAAPSQFQKRSKFYALVAAAAIGVGATWWGLQDPPPPVLPQTKTFTTQIVGVFSERQIDVFRHGERKPFATYKEATEVPPEYITNTREFNLVQTHYYSIAFPSHKVLVDWQVSRNEFKNWKVGDKVQVTASEDGTPLGLKRLSQ